MDAKAIHERLVAKFGEKVTAVNLEVASPFAVVAADAIVEVARFCKSDPDLAFDNLMRNQRQFFLQVRKRTAHEPFYAENRVIRVAERSLAGVGADEY